MKPHPYKIQLVPHKKLWYNILNISVFCFPDENRKESVMGQFKIKLKAIVKHDGKFLLVKRWYDDRILEPYQWEFLDGEMNFGERLDEAAQRIVLEQTQLVVTNGTPYYTWSYVVGDTCYVGICYLFETMAKEVFISEELVDYAWVEKHRLNEYHMDEKVRKDVLAADKEELSFVIMPVEE